MWECFLFDTLPPAPITAILRSPQPHFGPTALSRSGPIIFLTPENTVQNASPKLPTPKLLSASIRSVECGEGVTIVEPSNCYECTLGAQVFVGPFVEIQSGVKVGPRTRIQSHAFICELVTIGEDCFIGHGAKFINDAFRVGGPARGRKELWENTRIGNRVSIGTNATILPVSICDDVVIGAGAVVTKDITVPGTYVGNPARFLKTSN